jgi:hypothetical protein
LCAVTVCNYDGHGCRGPLTAGHTHGVPTLAHRTSRSCVEPIAQPNSQRHASPRWLAGFPTPSRARCS